MPTTAKNTSPIRSGERAPCETKSSTTTGASALAAEKRKATFLPSTTSTGEEPNTESLSAGKSTQTLNDKGSRRDIESFAGIATGLTGSVERVLIKREGDSFVWPESLPTFVPSSPLTVAANVLRWGTGALNIAATRIPTDDKLGGGAYAANPTDRGQMWGDDAGNSWRRGGAGEFVQPTGRWPANVVHDGSDEVLAAFPDAPGAMAAVRSHQTGHDSKRALGAFNGNDEDRIPRGDSGSAARFFYTAKADTEDRIGSKHPTVKPVALMQWLVRLITPRGGVVLDPFAGTGTTAEAAWREGMRSVLIEREGEYLADIARRLSLADAGPDARLHARLKAGGKVEAPESLPLFAPDPAA